MFVGSGSRIPNLAFAGASTRNNAAPACSRYPAPKFAASGDSVKFGKQATQEFEFDPTTNKIGPVDVNSALDPKTTAQALVIANGQVQRLVAATQARMEAAIKKGDFDPKAGKSPGAIILLTRDNNIIAGFRSPFFPTQDGKGFMGIAPSVRNKEADSAAALGTMANSALGTKH